MQGFEEAATDDLEALLGGRGSHGDSIRPKVFRSRSNACCPPSPPISTCDAGRLATTIAPGAARAASVSDCTKVKFASNDPAGGGSGSRYNWRMKATHSSMSTMQGAVFENSSTSRSEPGLNPCSSERATMP